MHRCEPLPDALPAPGRRGAAFLVWDVTKHPKFLTVPKVDPAGLGLPTKRRCVSLAVVTVAAVATGACKLRKVFGGAADGTGSERQQGGGARCNLSPTFLSRHVTPAEGRGEGAGRFGPCCWPCLRERVPSEQLDSLNSKGGGKVAGGNALSLRPGAGSAL